MKHFTKQDYAKLIGDLVDLGYPVMPLKDRIGGGVLLRHDIDDDIEAAVEMAQMEAEWGIRSTYFILNTAPYWPTKLDKLNIIEDLGHEIGWHNNAISDSMRRGIPIKQAVEEPLLTLWEYGFDIVGTASHGDSMCYNKDKSLRFVNYDIWTDNPSKEREQWQTLSLDSVHLEYEAYWIGHTHYISESGGVWRQNNEKVMETFDKCKSPDKMLQILVHPQWWQL